MLCEKCKLNDAKIHIVKIVNGKKSSMNLCEECAKIYENIILEASNGKNINNLVSNLFEAIHGYSINPDSSESIQCPKCGLTLDGFKRSGRLGCNECYETFISNLEVVLDKVQGKNVHIGKIPEKSESELKIKNQIFNLKKDLKEKIKKEEFEDAALLRDEIKMLEKNLVGGGAHE